MKHTYTVTGMTCNGCKASVEKHLGNLPNIAEVLVSLERSEAIIEMQSYISIKELQQTLPEKFSINEKLTQNDFNPVLTEGEKTDFQKLKPLFLIFTYITIASLLLHYKLWDWRHFMLDFMGLFYVVFSFFKILDLKGFVISFKMYDPMAKAIPFYPLVYPFIELGLGMQFLMRVQIPLALVVTIFILGITTIGVTKALLDKKNIQCACLGTALKLPMTKATFIENTIMIVMAIMLLLQIYTS